MDILQPLLYLEQYNLCRRGRQGKSEFDDSWVKRLKSGTTTLSIFTIFFELLGDRGSTILSNTIAAAKAAVVPPPAPAADGMKRRCQDYLARTAGRVRRVKCH